MTPKVPYGLGSRALPLRGAYLTPLPFYAILRSIPNKTLGILAMAGALLLLPLLPLEQRLVGVGGLNPSQMVGWRESPRSTPTVGHALRVSLLAVIFGLLGFIGSQPVAEPYLSVGQGVTLLYFLLLASLPLSTLRPLPPRPWN
jgi:ubiquinol-cytochrome c reductase cytochrome b subunit